MPERLQDSFLSQDHHLIHLDFCSLSLPAFDLDRAFFGGYSRERAYVCKTNECTANKFMSQIELRRAICFYNFDLLSAACFFSPFFRLSFAC